MCDVKYHKIRKVEKRGTYSILWVQHITFPIKIPRPPVGGAEWAGILYLGKEPWLLYDYADKKEPNIKRKI